MLDCRGVYFMDKNTLNAYTHLEQLLDKLMTRYNDINTCQY